MEEYDFRENNMNFSRKVDGASSAGDSVNEKVENEENEEKVEKQEKQQRPRSNSGSRFLTDQVDWVEYSSSRFSGGGGARPPPAQSHQIF